MQLCILIVTTIILASLSGPAPAQECDTHSQCLGNGMCMPDGSCEGMPLTGGSCDIVSDVLCQVNGHCVNGACMGDPAPAGTSCASGCGTCEEVFPGVPILLCKPLAPQLGQPCDPKLGACFTGVCQGTTVATCVFALKQCPDVDHNVCTSDFCNPATGVCEHADQPPCIPQCETCTPGVGCMPANIGAACDNLGECPVESSCQTFSGRGLCLPGTPSSTLPTATPTMTATPVAATATATPRPGECVGDCNQSGQVKSDDLLLGMSIALAVRPIGECPSLNVNDDDRLQVHELLRGVNTAVSGCTL